MPAAIALYKLQDERLSSYVKSDGKGRYDDKNSSVYNLMYDRLRRVGAPALSLEHRMMRNWIQGIWSVKIFARLAVLLKLAYICI